MADSNKSSMATDIIGSITDTANIGLGIAGLVAQTRANTRQEAMQRELYYDARNWSSPANQMNLRRAAGLNPYGDFPVSSPSQPNVVNTAQGIPELINGLQGSLSRTAEHAFESMSQRIAFKSLELQEKSLDKDIRMTDAEIDQLRSNTAYQDLINEITEATKGSRIQLTKNEAEKLVNDILLQKINIEYLPKQLKETINNLVADTTQKYSQAGLNDYQKNLYLPQQLQLATNLNKAQIDNMVKQLDKIAAETNKAKADTKVSEAYAENLGISKAGLKELKSMIDSTEDGVAKTLLKFMYLTITSGILQDIHP